MPKESSFYRASWGAKVVEQLGNEEGQLEGKIIEIHAGAKYIGAIKSLLISRGAIVSEPLIGLKFGERLRWYNKVSEGLNSKRMGDVAGH